MTFAYTGFEDLGIMQSHLILTEYLDIFNKQIFLENKHKLTALSIYQPKYYYLGESVV